jgi:hypothetical protein
LHQALTGHAVFFCIQHFIQDPPVLAQSIVDVTHSIVGIGIQPVIESAPALVGAEFFIASSFELGPAFLTGNHSSHWLKLMFFTQQAKPFSETERLNLQAIPVYRAKIKYI